MSKLPTTAKLGLLGAIVVSALVAGWFVAIAPKRSEAAKLAAQIADTRTQIAAVEASRSNPRAAAPAIRVADLFRLSRAMPNRADVPGVLLQLSRVAHDTGIVFKSITPHDPVQQLSYQQVGIDLVFEGRFYDLSDLLYRLRNLVGVHEGVLNATGRLFSVDKIAFDQGTLRFPQVKATLTISAFVFGDGTAAPIPAASMPVSAASSSTPAAESSQPVPVAPPGARTVGT